MLLTVHHLHVSQSERIVWLREELGLTYTLKCYNRSPLFAPPEYKGLHPQGSAPTIQDTDGDQDITLAESAACIEWICRKNAGGKLLLGPDHSAYADFLYWFHWSNGTLQPAATQLMISRSADLEESALDDRLKDNKWLAGDEFTAADVMMGFPLTTMRYFTQLNLQEFPYIVKYIESFAEREPYQRAMQKENPDLDLALGAESPKRALV
ncbi:hypothetical protein BDW71DRAFT_212697 [Aspergillus fruticulosus]